MNRIIFYLITFFLLPVTVFSDSLTIHMPIVEDSPTQHKFYHELLESALTAKGHTPKIIAREMPQTRIKRGLDKGALSVYWMVESKERNEKYLPIEVGITNGLIGKRVLFIKKGDQHRYDKVKTLDDFRNLKLVGGMGKNWFDVNVWKANSLEYVEQPGNWKSIFKMIPKGRTYNYFSRGLNEIIAESKQNPDLAIEKNLVLIYDRDFRFYLSKAGENAGRKYFNVISDALKAAQSDGLIEKLVRKYWASDFETLNFDRRKKLKLETPK